MADGNFAMPEWMQRRALMNEQSNEQSLASLADVIGSAVTAGVASATGAKVPGTGEIDPKTGQVKPGTERKYNFLSAYNDAYQSLRDPYYILKRQQGQYQLEDAKLKLESQRMDWQNATEGKQVIRDYNLRWKTEGKGDPDWVSKHPMISDNPNAMKWYEQLDTTISVDQNRRDTLKIKQDNDKAATSVRQRITEWTNAFAQASPEAQAAIGKLGNDAYETDTLTGARIPSLEGITLLNQDRAKQGKAPFGASPADIAAFSRERVETKKEGAVAAKPITKTVNGVLLQYDPEAKEWNLQYKAPEFNPRVVTLPDGTSLIQISPNRYQVGKGANSQKMTPAELLKLATDLEATGDKADKSKAKKIRDFLGKEAETEMTAPVPGAGTTPATNADPLGLGIK